MRRDPAAALPRAPEGTWRECEVRGFVSRSQSDVASDSALESVAGSERRYEPADEPTATARRSGAPTDGATAVVRSVLRAERDAVIEEVPIALVYNGISHAVMLATPADLEDFALGFSLTEGIVPARADVHDIEVVSRAEGIEVRLTIAASRIAALKERRRALAGRTGCGLCGVETLRDAVRPVRAVGPGGRLCSAALERVWAELAVGQHLHQTTGAAHAAGFATWDGALRWLREDVGRHNALDKLVGAMARARVDPASGFIAVTSRASYEMVHKTAAAGVGLLAALSAPTALAIRTAEQAGVTLIGSAGRSRRLVYAHPQRLRPD